MGECSICGKSSNVISRYLSLCRDCIIEKYSIAEDRIVKNHSEARSDYDLPPVPPRKGPVCHRCGNACGIEVGERGYCGMVENRGGTLKVLSNIRKGYLSHYDDPLPTNCVASWVCPARTDAGYPEYSHKDGPEYGYRNLAVFYHSCTYDCLFCQNNHFRTHYLSGATSSYKLADEVSERTACICYFGGDPTSQIEHSLQTSRIALKSANEEGRILRICWETNGSMSTRIAKQMMDISLRSGGIIKIDLKALTEHLHFALTGVSNLQTLQNIEMLSKYFTERPEPPPMVVSTLLVPGYVNAEEVEKIAEFLVSLNSDIPYSLLAFHPHHKMSDLPTTSINHAKECYDKAKEVGLKRVNLANRHLLRREGYG